MWESHPHKTACSVLTSPSAGKCFPFSRSSGSSACDTESAGPCWPGSVTACGAKALLGTTSPSTETQHRYSCFRKAPKQASAWGIPAGSWWFLSLGLCVEIPNLFFVLPSGSCGSSRLQGLLLGPLAHQAVNLRGDNRKVSQHERGSLSFYRASRSLPKASFPNRHRLPMFLFQCWQDKTQASVPGLHPAVSALTCLLTSHLCCKGSPRSR